MGTLHGGIGDPHGIPAIAKTGPLFGWANLSVYTQPGCPERI